MKKLFFIAVAVLAQTAAMAVGTDTMTVRIKAMRCEDCARKVMLALNEAPGVDDVNFNLERRTATISYDGSLITPDSICARLAATKRFKPTAYNPKDVIRRGMGMHMDDMNCEECAERIMNAMQNAPGIDSMAPRLNKHYMFIRYDANRTCKADIRKALVDLGFTPVNHYTSDKIDFGYYTISDDDAAQPETAEKVLILDGVEDVNINADKKTMAVTYFNDETTADKLLKGIKESGIKATPATPKACKK